jgi:lipoprotein-anchoring transpeptidase ErfK/SrfK
MGRISTFLQAPRCARVPDMFPESGISVAYGGIADGRQAISGKSHASAPKSDSRLLILRDKLSSCATRTTTALRVRTALALPLFGSLLLTACGFNGTDPDEDAKAPSAAAAAPVQASGEILEQIDLADSEPRPLMQLQVVLDRQGFGPGVIDGREGLSTTNALKGFQEANDLEVTGELDLATRGALAKWDDIAATRVVRIPESWGRDTYREVPDEPADQAKLDRLGYASIDERLAERFHTKIEVLQALNPGGRPAQSASPASSPTPTVTPSATAAQPAFRAGQLVRVPNAGVDTIRAGKDDKPDWLDTLASLGVDATQPEAARVVVDKSEGSLKAYDANGKLLALFTVTTGSSHDPLPLGDWGITGVSRNPPFMYDPDLFWDVPDHEEEQQLPPGPNGPVGVAWIDLTREHYGIHGTPAPETIGRTQSHGCVRLTNWDVARLAGMVDGSTKVTFEA